MGKLRRLAASFFRRFEWLINALLKPVYRIYEWYLYSQIYSGPMPKHVAIIPDGNRRWARCLGLNPLEGHEYGYEKIKEVLEWLWELGVKVVTIYTMSYENCVKRSEEERKHLFKLLERAVDELMKKGIIEERKIRIKFMGHAELLPKTLVDRIREIEERSSAYGDRVINLALCYGGRQEIVEGVKRVAREVLEGKLKPEEINEEVFRDYLFTSHLKELEQPDLVIRTSGELRISNFLLWQIAYSELYFCEANWPEFRKIDLWRAIRSYQRRERRFGR